MNHNNPSVQAQRAGVQVADSEGLFPNVWSYKRPAYTSVCTEVLGALDAADAAKVNLKDYVGYFEAGSASRISFICCYVQVYKDMEKTGVVYVTIPARYPPPSHGT